MRSAAVLILLAGCGHDPVGAPEDLGAPDLAEPPGPDGSVAPPEPLLVRFLGVGGYLIRTGDQALMTGPLYTRPSMTDVTFGVPMHSDPSLVQNSLPAGALAHLRAIVVGHAHYDHLLDTPEILRAAPGALLYSNASAAHLLAALAPDRAPSCTSPAPANPIDRARVIALDDPAASRVDYRPCTDQKPDGAPLEGSWVRVPGSQIRLYPICSVHPDQVGPYHFGPGDVDTDQCDLPTDANQWREGHTLAYLIDFLDAADQPVYRIYYQDAPTSVPVGIPPGDVLAEKRVDLALLNVGNYDRVVDAPAATLAALGPRFALGGHWEDFFQPASAPPQPLPLHDIPAWIAKAQAALPSSVSVDPMWLSGAASPGQRALVPQPGDIFSLEIAP